MKTEVATLISPGQFEFEEKEITISDDEVLIKNICCGLCSWELSYFRGEIKQYPQVVGHEPVGIIEEVRSKVKDFKKGDRVTGFWGAAFSNYSVANPKYLVKVKDNLELKHAIIEPLFCTVTISRAAAVEFGDDVLVIGCGFMGLLFIASIAGNTPGNIIAVDLKESNLSLAKEFGANIILNPKKDDVGAQIQQITKGVGVDIAIEATGSPAGLEVVNKYLKMNRPKVLLVSAYVGEKPFNLLPWAEKGAIVYNPHPAFCLNNQENLGRAISALEKGIFPMDKLITHEFSLDNIQQAFEMLQNKPEGYIKGIVVP